MYTHIRHYVYTHSSSISMPSPTPSGMHSHNRTLRLFLHRRASSLDALIKWVVKKQKYKSLPQFTTRICHTNWVQTKILPRGLGLGLGDGRGLPFGSTSRSTWEAEFSPGSTSNLSGIILDELHCGGENKKCNTHPTNCDYNVQNTHTKNIALNTCQPTNFPTQSSIILWSLDPSRDITTLQL